MDRSAIWESYNEPDPCSRETMMFASGFILGIAMRPELELDDAERIILARGARALVEAATEKRSP